MGLLRRPFDPLAARKKVGRRTSRAIFFNRNRSAHTRCHTTASCRPRLLAGSTKRTTSDATRQQKRRIGSKSALRRRLPAGAAATRRLNGVPCPATVRQNERLFSRNPFEMPAPLYAEDAASLFERETPSCCERCSHCHWPRIMASPMLIYSNAILFDAGPCNYMETLTAMGTFSMKAVHNELITVGAAPLILMDAIGKVSALSLSARPAWEDEESRGKNAPPKINRLRPRSLTTKASHIRGISSESPARDVNAFPSAISDVNHTRTHRMTRPRKFSRPGNFPPFDRGNAACERLEGLLFIDVFFLFLKKQVPYQALDNDHLSKGIRRIMNNSNRRGAECSLSPWSSPGTFPRVGREFSPSQPFLSPLSRYYSFVIIERRPDTCRHLFARPCEVFIRPAKNRQYSLECSTLLREAITHGCTQKKLAT